MRGGQKGTHMKKYKVKVELAVRDAAAVIRAGKRLYSADDWKREVEEFDGDELLVAVSTLFAWTFVPDYLAEAIDFLAGGCESDGELPSDWAKRAVKNLASDHAPFRQK
jgi:hypothetical protein